MTDTSKSNATAAPPDRRGPEERPRLFRRVDWLTFAVTTVLVFVGYLLTLAPDVTLEDSGELAVAANYAGVPHPPGYPLWTIYAWSFTELIPFGNIAWRVALSSAVAGALASGILALMVSRGSSMILESMPELREIDARRERALCLISGAVAGLLLGFNGFMWSQAVIVEVYTLSALSFALVLLCLLRWLYNPADRRYLCAAFLLFGVSFTNHQTLILAAMGIELLILLARPRVGRDLFFANSVVFIIGLLLRANGSLVLFDDNPGLFALFLLIGLASMGICAWATMKTGELLSEWKTVLAAGGCWLIGALLYFYLPIASMTNPPMNWAYPRTWEGFLHALSRGQYEPTQPTANPIRLFRQVMMYVDGAMLEFNPAFLLVGLVPFLFLPRMGRREQAWIVGLTGIYLCLSLLLLILLNPDINRQSRDLTKVFFTPSHMIIAIAIGYGLTLIGGCIAARYEDYRRPLLFGGAIVCGIALFGVAKQWEATQWPLLRLAALFVLVLATVFVGVILYVRTAAGVRRAWAIILPLFALMPLFSVLDHWSENEQRGHLFGYWFGHDMFKPPFDLYPEMAEDAILFGGTDPGRFTPTYMIFCESFLPPEHKRDPDFDRRDVYIITQNALADGTYLQYIRAHYNRSAQQDPPFFQTMVRRILGMNQHTTNWLVKAVRPLDRFFTNLGERIEADRREQGIYPEEEIYTPTPEDAQDAFEHYARDALRRQKAGGLKPGERIDFQGDLAEVTGPSAVMVINGRLAKTIFENNPDHEFYVEESFPIDWMYPHLKPYGTIMKLRREELPEITQEMVRKNHEFWKRYSERLIGDWIDYDTPITEISEFVIRVYERRSYPSDFEGNRKFVRDEQAQKAFSKLRSAQAGLYAWRMNNAETREEQERMLREADFAFRQAFAFAPYSPEVIFRYSEMLAGMGRVDEALIVARTGQVFDPNNQEIEDLIRQLNQLKSGRTSSEADQLELERLRAQYQKDPTNRTNVLGLVRAHLQLGQTNMAKEILRQAMTHPQADAELILQVAQAYLQLDDISRLEEALNRLVELTPESPEAWYDLAAIQAALGKHDAALASLETMLEQNRRRLQENPEADDLRDHLRDDNRFNEIRGTEAFQRLLDRRSAPSDGGGGGG